MATVLLGIDDSVSVCDCCGKKNLKCTVVLELDGDIVHYGRDCAGAALYGRKDRKNGIQAEQQARCRAKVEPVISVIRAALPQGYHVAKAAGEAAAKGLYVRGGTVLVTGFVTFGYIRVYWEGGYEEIITG